MDCPRLRYDALSDAAEAELATRGLQVLEGQVDKVVQLHEARACFGWGRVGIGYVQGSYRVDIG